MSTRSILLTRRMDPALVQKAREKDIQITEIDFIQVDPCADHEHLQQLAGGQADVVFTSKNSVIIVGEALKGAQPDWRVFCTEGATEDRATGFFGKDRIAGTARGAEGLARVVVNKNEGREVIFFCGEKRRDELPDALNENDVPLKEVIVYETRLLPQEVMQHFHGIAFFSPSAVDSFFSVNVVDDSTIFFAVGPTTAKSLHKLARNKVVVCERASEESMLDAILREFRK